MIDAGALQAWLRDSLSRPDLAARIAHLGADTSLDDDMRLLLFCHELWDEMPTLWRGRTLDAGNLDAAARAALGGSAPDAEWLDSLADQRAFDFYGARGRIEVAELGRSWDAALADHNSTWDAVIAMGGPANARPPAAMARLNAARLVANQEARAQVRQRARALLGPSEWLRRAPWFLQFGSDIESLGEARLEALHALDGASLLAPPVRAHLDELGGYTPERLQTLRSGLLVSPLQEQSFNNLELEPGSEVITLLPGQRHYPAEAWTLGRAVRYWVEAALAATKRTLTALARAAWQRIRQRARGTAAPAAAAAGGAVAPAVAAAAAAQTTPPPAQPRGTVEVRMVRVRLRFDVSVAPLQANLARISWNVPDGARVRIRLAHLEGWPAWPLLNLRKLPTQGQFLVLLFTSTRVRLLWRESGWRWQRTAPIDIWLPEADRLRAAPGGGSALRHPAGAMRAVTGMAQRWVHMRGSLSLLRRVRRVLLPAGQGHQFTTADARAMHPSTTAPRVSRRLDRFELALLRRYLVRNAQ